MRRSSNIIIWVAALVLVIGAAYTYYSRNKTEGAGLLPQQNQSRTGVTNQLPGASQPETTQNGSLQGSTAQTGTSGNEKTQTEKVMAPDFTLKDTDGNSFKLSDYKGKIVILNFWAVWCKYCKLEMPDLNKLNKELEKKNEAVLLAIDVQESADTVREYLSSNGFSLKALLDEDGSVAQTYGVSGYPTTLVINPDGSIYAYTTGETDEATLLKAIDMIRNGESLK
ncbi:MAG TPA: TlpA disulfide reductase family protein [Clostridia bacterium]|nr:TlpA disulfide reductase family protein [Clostridia bacterium]